MRAVYVNYILDAIKSLAEFRSAVLSCKKKIPAQVTGVSDNAQAAFCAALSDEVGKKLLIVCDSEKYAYRISEELEFYGKRSLVFPARDFILDNVVGYSREWEHERLRSLGTLLRGDFDVVLAVPDAVMQYTMPRATLLANTVELKAGQKISPVELAKKLTDMGYVRSELVEGRGQFSVRGGILDLFSPQNENPVRLDFWGDVIDSMGYFSAETQRRFEKIESTMAVPAEEVFLDSKAREKVKNEVKKLVTKAADEKVKSLLTRELDALSGEERFHAADKYFSLIYPEKETVVDYAGDVRTVVIDSKRVADRAAACAWKFEKETEGYCEVGALERRNCDLQMSDTELISSLSRSSICLDLFMTNEGAFTFNERFGLDIKRTNPFSAGVDTVMDELKSHITANHRILMLCATEYSALNTIGYLKDKNIPVFSDGVPKPGVITVTASGTNAPVGGFEVTEAGFVLFTDAQSIRGKLKTAATREGIKRKDTEKIISYADLAEGDLVVHVDHGIGRYDGITNLTVDGVSKDYIKLQYRGTDVLYVPCTRLDMISKYIGGSRDTQSLSKLGGNDWQNAKARVKKAAKNIARELIELYAERNKKQGFAFTRDDDLQTQFESAFEYVETEGQLSATADIKRDMESVVPMDRLLCGDVGFGKTEVALRAVFKCVQDSKQCALLVPTTILAWQHYQTMLSRFRAFPVRVDMLSRFKTKQAQEETLRRLRRGEIDVVVGTHRLLQKDVIFKDLGLLVVDEEQRFGVTHKEKLKQLAKNVDCLTLTATPIPRTLNMALSGIRDMSLLEEAPQDRRPVQTFVLEHDDVIINEAIKSELRRGGQVFYLHNDTESIYGKALALQNAFPDATVGVAHGKMPKDELSEVWESLVKGETDILVCTTIIETGVDVPNANTLIIENANNFGLSQLHQIRGRVGRSYRKSYAYLTFKPNKILTEIAEKRLEAIKEYTEFGSGFKIAQRDLELRGAGNLLGAEQHGNMESVGYDLYIKLLEEAVLEEKGEKKAEKPDTVIDVSVDGFIPERYVHSSRMRIDIYKKIAAAENSADAEDLKNELADRFGKLPQSVSNLIDISLIRRKASELGFTSIEQRGGRFNLYSDTINPEDVMIMIREKEMRGRLTFSPGNKKYLSCRVMPNEQPLDGLKLILELYTKISQK